MRVETDQYGNEYTIGYSNELKDFKRAEGQTHAVIPEGVTSIGFEAFRGCTRLTSVVIPDSVTAIGDGAFYGCRELTVAGSGASVTTKARLTLEASYPRDEALMGSLKEKVTTMRGLLTRSGLNMAGIAERLLVVRLIKRLITVPVDAELVYVSGLAMKERVRTFLLCMDRLDRVWDAAEQDTSKLVRSLPVELGFHVLYCAMLGEDRYTLSDGNSLDHVSTVLKCAIRL